ncbi:PilN domain-containing protein [Lysobacter sp. GX 14042]|uniref:PilN domain-containing protein n=1 Tax=Lysobacter sp. GX 14042 TaxID=2907155 RepID=UPI001F20C72E|nr:PilN domain-containing protein [Lysobacter sp. GX 14042]MCE7032752.1 PilN domain-containing protein [Lysobacter sp. GX 14042]
MSVTGAIPGSALDRIGVRLAGAGGFMGWWGRSLAQLLPRRLRRALELEPGRILLEPVGESVRLRLQREDRLRDLAALDRSLLDPALQAGLAPAPDRDPLASQLDPSCRHLPRWLLLPPAAALCRRLRLPAAAGERLRQVAGFEIERQTPFTADAVVFDARALGPAADGQLDVELVVVPRAQLQPRLDALGPLAGTLAGIDVAAGDGRPLGINLLAPAQRHRLRDPWTAVNSVLLVIALLALVAAGAQLLDNRRDAADALEAALAARAEAGRQEAASLRQAQLLLQGQGFLERTRAARPTATAVLAELTGRLPDDTYLEKLSIEGDQLMLIGLGRSPAGLVERLQGAALWQSPALAGAVMPDPASGRDRFTLTARLATPATPAGNPEAADGDGPG